MAKDVEQGRAEIREEIFKQTGVEAGHEDPEGHEPLSGLVGNRAKEASEPDPDRAA